jgi:hypothetical protein
VAALPLAGFGVLAHARAADPHWHEAERRVYARDFRGRVGKVLRDTWLLYERARPQLDLPPGKRDPNQVEQLPPLLDEQLGELTRLGAGLRKAGPYGDADTRQEWENDVRHVEERAGQFAEAARALRAGAATPEQGGREEREFERLYLHRANDLLLEARKLHRDEVRPLLELAPRRRDPDALGRALTAAERMRRRLASLADEFGRAGPYVNSDVEAARQSGQRQAEAWARLFDLSTLGLRAGAAFPADDAAALRRQEEEVERLWKGEPAGADRP